MGSGASLPEEDALSDLLLKGGDRVAGGGTKKIIDGWFASYALKHQLGDGGYGVVWKAAVLEGHSAHQTFDLKMGDSVAVKILNAEGHIQELLAQNEIENMRACIHPNILRIHDHCKDGNGNQCLILEFVAGGTLEDYLVDLADDLPEEEACRMFGQIVDAISCVHAAGIIHCDLKPSNFMLDTARNIKVIDFGSSCRKEVGQEPRDKARGTPVYSSPEQIDLKEFDESADFWSLGIILHEMLTGELPENAYEVVRRGHELPEPGDKKFKDSAWKLITELVTSRSKRAVARDIQQLLDEWSQDIQYGDAVFCQDDLEDHHYDGEDFEPCSSEDEIC